MWEVFVIFTLGKVTERDTEAGENRKGRQKETEAGEGQERETEGDRSLGRTGI